MDINLYSNAWEFLDQLNENQIGDEFAKYMMNENNFEDGLNIRDIETFINYGLNLNSRCIDGFKYFSNSIEKNLLTPLCFMLEMYSQRMKSINITEDELITVLSLFIKNGADPNIVCDRFESRMVHHLASGEKLGRSKKILDKFLRIDIDVDVHNYAGFTPLYLAISSRNTEVFKKLLDLGCRLDIPTNVEYVEYPILRAMQMNNEYLELLLKAGADPDFQDDKHMPSLFHAMNSKSFLDIEAADLLLKYGGNINIQEHKNEWGCMHYLISRSEGGNFGKKDLIAVKYLLDNGYNMHLADVQGNTAMHMLAKSYTMQSSDYHSKIMDMLIDRGYDLTLKNKDGENMVDIL